MAIAWHAARRLPPALMAASAAGWLLLAGQNAAASLSALCLSATRIDDVLMARLTVAFALEPPWALALAWLTMILAMMPPLVARPLLHIWRRSLPRRRVRAGALFILGYAVVWLAAGILLSAGIVVAGGIGLMAGVPPLLCAAVIALVWQATPLKQAALNRCHRQPPLAAFGLRAETDVLRYGVSHGIACAGTCWALMLLPLAAEGWIHWPVMALVTLAAIVERVRAPDLPRWGAALPRLPDVAPWRRRTIP